MVYDFHTHTFLSDGSLSPIEQVRRASIQGYYAIGLTDHVGIGHLERLVSELTKDCALAEAHWGIRAIPGVELTHVPPPAIAQIAEQARKIGAKLVIVHGETIWEPVEAGTNLAAVECPYVDILAHPGLLSREEASIAAQNDIFIEITARAGHSLTNGHVAKTALLAGAKLLVNSDAHGEGDLLTASLAHSIAQGAGLREEQINEVLKINPHTLLNKLNLQK